METHHPAIQTMVQTMVQTVKPTTKQTKASKTLSLERGQSIHKRIRNAIPLCLGSCEDVFVCFC